MPVSEAELAAMRARADHLRKEIRAFRTESVGTRLEADRDSQAEALQQEIKRLEAEVVDAAQSSGGSVEDALAAMQRAEELQKMMAPADEEAARQQNENVDGEQSNEVPGDTGLPVVDRPELGEQKESEGSR